VIDIFDDTNEKLIGIIKNINHAYSIKNKDLDYQEFSLFGMVEDIREKTLEKNEVNITIDNRVDSEMEIVSDRFILESAIIELMQNAVIFRDREIEESTLIIHAEKWGHDHVRMTFEDNGIGIQGATKKEIFNMFNKDTAYSSGLGLGLYIVKDSLKKLKGNARLADSEPGKTVFEIQFPIGMSQS
jgi:signal transduction histidine kinase